MVIRRPLALEGYFGPGDLLWPVFVVSFFILFFGMSLMPFRLPWAAGRTSRMVVSPYAITTWRGGRVVECAGLLNP